MSKQWCFDFIQAPWQFGLECREREATRRHLLAVFAVLFMAVCLVACTGHMVRPDSSATAGGGASDEDSRNGAGLRENKENDAQRARASAPAESFSSAKTPPRARVIIVQDPEATDAFRPRPDRIRAMVNRGITNLLEKSTTSNAWRSLVSERDVVGLKVFSTPGPNSGTRPAVVAAVIEGLLAAGLPPTNIIIWDKQARELIASGFFDLARHYGVRMAASAQSGYDPNTFYDTPLLGNLVWGDSEFGKTGSGVGRKSFVSKLVSKEVTRIINITPLLNHNEAGVSGNLYGLAMGSVDNTVRFESDPERLATAVPEIYALPSLSDHVVLNIVDALICQYEGSERGLLHYSTTLNQLRFSRDPVALDILSLQELDRQRPGDKPPKMKSHMELYDTNAGLLLELGVSDLRRIDVDILK